MALSALFFASCAYCATGGNVKATISQPDGLKRVSFAPAMGRLKTVTGGRISFTLQRDSQERP